MAVDVTEVDFDAVVLDGSRDHPVVVDFWASWCAPCRSLGPVLERVAAETGVALVKVDVDANPNLAAAFGVRSIPMVLAFKDARPVTEFVGAIPEQAVRTFFAELQPTETDRLVEAAETELDRDEKQQLLRRALELEPGHERGVLALAAQRAEAGDAAEARALLARIPPGPETQRLLAALELRRTPPADLRTLRDAAAARPDDPRPLTDLGRALAASGDHAEALDVLLRAASLESDEARRAMIDLFVVLGDDHELTRAYRPRLAAALF